MVYPTRDLVNYMHALMTASSTEMSTRIWMHVPYAVHLHYKIRKDDPGDVEGEPPRKRVPALQDYTLCVIYILFYLFFT